MSTLHVENLKGLSSGGNANKIIIPSGQTLDASNGLTTPSGHIIQVLHQEITALTQTTSTSDVATGFTLTITPKFSSSKIKCTVGINGVHANTVQSSAEFNLYKGGSHYRYLHSVIGYNNTILSSSDSTMMTVDSPNTTSAVTYSIRFRRGHGSGIVYFNNYASGSNRTRSWFTVEEIAQ